jgi:hypothetical protein
VILSSRRQSRDANANLTVEMNPLSLNRIGGRFTACVYLLAMRPLPCRVAPESGSPTGLRTVSSATEMNSAGASSPRAGCCTDQRFEIHAFLPPSASANMQIGIVLSQHADEDGAMIFQQACKLAWRASCSAYLD